MILQFEESRSAVTQILQFEEKSPKKRVLVLNVWIRSVSSDIGSQMPIFAPTDTNKEGGLKFLDRRPGRTAIIAIGVCVDD